MVGLLFFDGHQKRGEKGLGSFDDQPVLAGAR
jgi:hypothetical protein